ncbi:PAS domain-containing sensor histidine kinase [Natronoarchaeum mannanilyticum]|uniref:PAS domain-containing sensor histidine kinase n=1 Tax=Natronoarchaeum mannanilyticum TaxID=926360 RepID=UPI00366E2FA6
MASDREPMTVLLVDPADAMGRVEEALVGEDPTITVGTVESPAAVSETDVDPDCIVVLEYEDAGVDGIELLHDVEDRVGDVPVVVFVIDPRAYFTQRALEEGAADVLAVGTGGNRESDEDFPLLLTRRVRHAADMGESFQTDSELLNSVMEYLPHQVFIKDDVGRIAAMSNVAMHEHEPTQKEIQGFTDHDLFDTELGRELYEEEQEIMETEEPIINRVEHYVEDGQDHWVSTTKAPRYDSDGDVVGIIGTARDVTEQKRREVMVNALHAASRDLVTAETRDDIAATAVDIADDIPDLPVLEVVLYDDEAEHLETAATGHTDESASVFERYEEWFRRAYESGVGQYVVSLSEDDPGAVVGYAKSEVTDGVDPIAVALPLGEHGVLGFASTSGTFDDAGVELAEVLAANVEATLDRAAREAELRERDRELERQNERLEEFASIVSHDLRNPLSVARGYLGQVDADEEIVAEIEWALDRMDRLTDELLTLARQGQIVGETERVSLSRVAYDAWQAIDGGAATLSVEDDVGSIESDPDRLVELLENLFRNAVEHAHTPDDPVTVTVGRTETGFFVEDDGPGIPDDEKGSIFEQGYTNSDDGTGFGLYIVRTLADAHGWTVGVTDAEDGGEGTDGSRSSEDERSESSGGARFEFAIEQSA